MEISERIEYFIAKEKYDEALNLCRSKDLDYLKQIVTGYINQGKIDSVMKKISKSFKFYNNKDLQYSIIKRLIKAGYNDEALEICQRDIYALDDNIKYKEILIYMKKEDYEEGLKVCENPLLRRSELVQYGRILLLFRLKRYDEIIKICEQKEFEDSKNIQYQHVEALESICEYEKALEICTKPKFNCLMEFVSKEKALKEKITEISNKEAIAVKVENITPLVSGYTLDTKGLSQPTGKKKVEKVHTPKVRTIYSVYEDDIIALGTYYISLLINIEDTAKMFYLNDVEKVLTELIELEKQTSPDNTKIDKDALRKDAIEMLGPIDSKYIIKAKKRVISAIDNIKYLEEQPLTDQESLDKVLKLIKVYKDYTKTNIDKTK